MTQNNTRFQLKQRILQITSLLITEDDSSEDYNEEEKGIILQANAIPTDLWEAILIWAKKENKLSLIARWQITNYIKKSENSRFFKTIKTAEKAIFSD